MYKNLISVIPAQAGIQCIARESLNILIKSCHKNGDASYSLERGIQYIFTFFIFGCFGFPPARE